MSHNTSVSLGSHFTDFVSEQVEGGRYSNTSEVVRSGLRLLEEHEAKLQALRLALDAGEQSGEAVAFDFDAFIAEKKTSMQKALTAVSALPKETQEALASSLLQEVKHLSVSSLTEEQRTIVEDRLSKPFDLASPKAVAAVHGKYS